MQIRDPEDYEQRLAGWVSSRNNELIGAPFVGQNSLSMRMGQNADQKFAIDLITRSEHFASGSQSSLRFANPSQRPV